MGNLKETMDTQQSETYRESVHREARRRDNHKHKGVQPEGVAHSGVHSWQDMGDAPPSFNARAFVDTAEIQDPPPPERAREARGKTACKFGSTDKVNPHRIRDVDFASDTPGSAWSAINFSLGLIPA